jgi:hypothetical protein
VAVVTVAAFYQPISFWARNAWDLSSPVKLLVIGAALGFVAVTIHSVLCRLGMKPLASGLVVGGSLMVFSSWERLRGTGALLILLIVIVGALAQRKVPTVLLDWLGLWFVAAFGLIPLLQLGVAHISGSTSIQVASVGAPGEVGPSGAIEDVVLVIVDAYPNLQIADTWFGHRPTDLVSSLEAQDFVVEPLGWSRHTFTSLSVTSILEGRSVIDDRQTEAWSNRSGLWRILRGDNLTTQTLKAAGFDYTHIDSNWDGSSCGPLVDRCIESPWIDERVWRMFGSTVAGRWVRHYNYAGTLNTAEALKVELDNLQGNGSNDFLFAHLLMPHEPVLVDDECQPLEQAVGLDARTSERRAAISGQMTCVDRLLTTALGDVAPGTAMLVTGDHGSGTGGQVGSPPDSWSDSDIGERFSVFLSYKLPSSCDSPSLPDPVTVMNRILTCATTAALVTSEPRYLIGDQDPVYVEPERMERIKAEVAAGTLLPESD